MELAESIDTMGRNLSKEQKQYQHLEQLSHREEYVIEPVDFEPEGDISLAEAEQSKAHPTRNNETEDHVRLKAAAAQYFRETGSQPVFEQTSWFGIADVGVETKTRFAECGVVRVGKLIEAFGQESSLALLGEVNPAYQTAHEVIYLPFSGNELHPPYRMIRISRKE